MTTFGIGDTIEVLKDGAVCEVTGESNSGKSWRLKGPQQWAPKNLMNKQWKWVKKAVAQETQTPVRAKTTQAKIKSATPAPQVRELKTEVFAQKFKKADVFDRWKTEVSACTAPKEETPTAKPFKGSPIKEEKMQEPAQKPDSPRQKALNPYKNSLEKQYQEMGTDAKFRKVELKTGGMTFDVKEPGKWQMKPMQKKDLSLPAGAEWNGKGYEAPKKMEMTEKPAECITLSGAGTCAVNGRYKYVAAKKAWISERSIFWSSPGIKVMKESGETSMVAQYFVKFDAKSDKWEIVGMYSNVEVGKSVNPPKDGWVSAGFGEGKGPTIEYI